MSESSIDRSADLVDRLVGVEIAGPLHAVRHARDKVVAATQGSYEALFDAGLSDPTLEERLLVALHACRLTRAPQLASHYRERLLAEGVDPRRIALAEQTGTDTTDD